MSVQVKEGYYVSKKYASLERFINYYYQIDTIRRCGSGKILFVGVGDGVVPFFLRRAGLEVVTLDFDAALAPDRVGDIRALPFADGSFDVACAFQVLEHVPFEESKVALAELARVSRGKVVLGVPHRRTGIEIVLKFPYIRSIIGRDFLRLALRIPVRFPGFAVSKQHYWEIDGHDMPLSRFRAALRERYVIEEEVTPLLDLYRRFFIVQKLP